MLDPIKQTIIYDQNAIYYGYSIERLMENAGRGIAEVLTKNYGRRKRIGIFCGPGNNGGDGFVAARYLEKFSTPEVYLIPDEKHIKSKESRKNWEQFKGRKFSNIMAQQIPDLFDIIVDCLFGTGVKGKVKEPYAAVINKLNHLKGKRVSVDLPSPSFKADFVISLMFKKTPKAAVVDIGYPKWLKERIGVGEVKVLYKPLKSSHKGQNGRLLIIGGNEKFHGAPLFAAKVASRIVDLVYFSSVPENNKLITKMKSKLCDFIAVPRKEVISHVPKVEVVLIGPGLGVTQETEVLTNKLLKKFPKKKFVLDADALKVLDKSLLNESCLVTPHKGEFRDLFDVPATKKNVARMAKKYGCTIVLKGVKDYVCDAYQCKINETGNAGMTKGGTGDVLAGLIAALACKSDLFLAASTGVFINGLAGDRLKEKVSYYYNAADLINEIPKTLKWCLDFSAQRCL